MNHGVSTVQDYLEVIPEERKEAIHKLRETILNNLPKGFEENFGYGMIGYVVPHTLYPAGYHCDPKQPLPFMGFASQKNFISFYHMGIYADAELLQWFQEEYAKVSTTKLDMGKSCVRFKKPDQIPFELIGRLVKKMNVKNWVKVYEKGLKKWGHETHNCASHISDMGNCRRAIAETGNCPSLHIQSEFRLLITTTPIFKT